MKMKINRALPYKNVLHSIRIKTSPSQPLNVTEKLCDACSRDRAQFPANGHHKNKFDKRPSNLSTDTSVRCEDCSNYSTWWKTL